MMPMRARAGRRNASVAEDGSAVRRSEGRGQGAVEFILVFPVVLVLMFGLFEFSRYYFTRISVQHAVREATRYAVTFRTTAGMDRPTSIKNEVTSRTDDIGVAVEDVTLDPADGGDPLEIVRVTATFRYRWIMPWIKDLVPNEVSEFEVTTAYRNEPQPGSFAGSGGGGSGGGGGSDDDDGGGKGKGKGGDDDDD